MNIVIGKWKVPTDKPAIIYAAAILAIDVSIMLISRRDSRKVKDVCEKLSLAYDELVEGVDVNINEAVVESAVETAAELASRKEASKAAEKIISEMRQDMKIRVRDDVDREFKSFSGKIKDEIEKKIGYIDISAVKDEVVERASSKAETKFNEELDSIATRFRSNLDDSAKILRVVSNKLE